MVEFIFVILQLLSELWISDRVQIAFRDVDYQ